MAVIKKNVYQVTFLWETVDKHSFRTYEVVSDNTFDAICIAEVGLMQDKAVGINFQAYKYHSIKNLMEVNIRS